MIQKMRIHRKYVWHVTATWTPARGLTSLILRVFELRAAQCPVRHVWEARKWCKREHFYTFRLVRWFDPQTRKLLVRVNGWRVVQDTAENRCKLRSAMYHTHAKLFYRMPTYQFAYHTSWFHAHDREYYVGHNCTYIYSRV